MGKIKLSDYIAKRLKNYGVELFFMVSGGGAMHLNDSLGRQIKYIANNHEQASAFCAEGYARVNQKLAVVNVTTGPGGLNCLNGVFGQFGDSVPVLYISGQVKTRTMKDYIPSKLRQLGDQEVDIIQTVKHLTKYSKCVKNPLEIKYHLDRAIFEATTGRFGPCWLDIPIDIQSSIIEENNLIEFRPEIKKYEKLDLKELIKKINNSKKPIIVAGHGIRLSNSIEIFKKFIKENNFPVLSTFNGFDIMEDDEDLSIGRIGTIGQRAANFALQNSDLVLFLGTRNNVRQVSYNWENFAKSAYKIIVDIDKEEINKPLVKYNMSFNSDLKFFLEAISKEEIKKIDNSWLYYLKKLKEKFSYKNSTDYKFQNNEKINPYDFIYRLTSKLNKNDTVVSANATPSICLFQVGINSGQRIIMNSSDASMGFSLSAGLGAYFQTSGRTIVLEGDGSIMMNIQELATIAHNKIPLKIFAINNLGYSSIKQTQTNFFNGHLTGCDMTSGVSNVDISDIAKGFKIKSVKLEEKSKIDKIIDEILNSNEPIICEVMTSSDYIFTPKLQSRKLEDGTMISPSLEDMYPFLDRVEFNKIMSGKI